MCFRKISARIQDTPISSSLPYFQWVAGHVLIVLTLIRLKHHCFIPGCNIHLMISSISKAIISLPKGYGTQARVSVRFLRRKWATREKLCDMVPKLHNHACIRPHHYSPKNTLFSFAGMHLGTQKKGPTPPPIWQKGASWSEWGPKARTRAPKARSLTWGVRGHAPPGKYWEKGA